MSYQMIDIVDHLCRSFLFEFPELYIVRHHMPVNLLSITHTDVGQETSRELGLT